MRLFKRFLCFVMAGVFLTAPAASQTRAARENAFITFSPPPAGGGAGMTYVSTYSGTTDGAGNITFTSANLGTGTSNKTVVVRSSDAISTITIGGSSATLNGTCQSNACAASLATNATSGNIVINDTNGAGRTMAIAVFQLIGASAAPAYVDFTANSGSNITINFSANDMAACHDWATTAQLPITWGVATKNVDLDGGSGYWSSTANYFATGAGSQNITTSNNYGVAGGGCWRYR